MVILLGILDALLSIAWWIIVIQVILSWLFAFNVLNTNSHGVRAFANALERISAPVYRPLRKILPDFGGLDFSPLVILLVIWVLQDRVLRPLIAGYRFG